jgi:HD-GYP domain-containing protein (c-di-GMP phosphodiesterase class II)
MTSDRSYRRALPVGVAAEELQRCAGTQFDAAVVAALLAVVCPAERAA